MSSTHWSTLHIYVPVRMKVYYRNFVNRRATQKCDDENALRKMGEFYLLLTVLLVWLVWNYKSEFLMENARINLRLAWKKNCIIFMLLFYFQTFRNTFFILTGSYVRESEGHERTIQLFPNDSYFQTPNWVIAMTMVNGVRTSFVKITSSPFGMHNDSFFNGHPYHIPQMRNSNWKAGT